MSNGTTLIPSPNSFSAHGLKMVRKDLERFSLGMSESSFGLGQVTNLTASSHAANAGLQEGDIIVNSWGVWGSTDTFDSKMRVVISVDGEEKAIEYWPRATEKVQAWEWIEG